MKFVTTLANTSKGIEPLILAFLTQVTRLTKSTKSTYNYNFKNSYKEKPLLLDCEEWAHTNIMEI
jgi:hypothetical protein